VRSPGRSSAAMAVRPVLASVTDDHRPSPGEGSARPGRAVVCSPSASSAHAGISEQVAPQTPAGSSLRGLDRAVRHHQAVAHQWCSPSVLLAQRGASGRPVLDLTQRLPLLLWKEVLVAPSHLLGLMPHEVVDDAVIHGNQTSGTFGERGHQKPASRHPSCRTPGRSSGNETGAHLPAVPRLSDTDRRHAGVPGTSFEQAPIR